MKIIFSSMNVVTDDEKAKLRETGVLNKNGTVVSWTRLHPFLKSHALDTTQAKLLITLEVNTKSPREEILRRLVVYLTKSEKSELLDKITNLL